MLKNLPANEGDLRDLSSIPELGRSPGVENGNLLLYSCLENSMDRGAWSATVCRVIARLRRLSTHTGRELRSHVVQGQKKILKKVKERTRHFHDKSTFTTIAFLSQGVEPQIRLGDRNHAPCNVKMSMRRFW